MSLLKQDTTRKGQIDEVVRQMEFDVEDNNSREYELEAIRDSITYTKEVDGHLLGLYYLVAWKGYPKEKNT